MDRQQALKWAAGALAQDTHSTDWPGRADRNRAACKALRCEKQYLTDLDALNSPLLAERKG